MMDKIISYDMDLSIDNDKEIPADERTGSSGYFMSMLCKQDKQQLDRIETMLNKLLGGE
jgi:hypothetical protein